MPKLNWPFGANREKLYKSNMLFAYCAKSYPNIYRKELASEVPRPVPLVSKSYSTPFLDLLLCMLISIPHLDSSNTL